MKLPYLIPKTEIPLSLKDGNLAREELLNQLYAISNLQSDTLLTTLITDFSSATNHVGICLINGSAHGYEFQDLVIQHQDDTFTIQKWSDAFETVQAYSRQLNLDLRAELQHLHQGDIIFRKHGVNRNIDHKSGMEGRVVTIYIVVGTSAEWLDYPNILRGGEYENTAGNRILCAIYEMEKDITLI